MRIKGIIALAVLFSTQVAALEESGDGVTREVVPQMIQADQPFTKDAVVTTDELVLPNSVRVNTIEKGSLDGVRYRFYYSDGSGTFAGAEGNDLTTSDTRRTNWSVSCKKDLMNGDVSCYAATRDIGIFVEKQGLEYLLIGANHYPGSMVAIKIGSAQPVEADSRVQFSSSQSGELLKQMGNGVAVVTRFQEWPRQYNKDDAFKLYGYNEVLAYLRWAVQRID